MKARKKKAAQRAAKRTTEMKEKIATNAENKKAEVVDSTEKTTTAKKTTTTKKTTTRKKTVKTSVLTPQNSEELQAAFVKNAEPETVAGPVHINEDLPVYLL